MHPNGFRDLVDRARHGDREAVERLLTLIRPWLDDLARGRADPADLAQEAWLRSWQKLDQFQGGGDDSQTLALFRAWLRRIVERLGLNRARDEQAQSRKPPGPLLRLDQPLEAEPAALEPPPAAHAEAVERAERVRHALERLPDDTDRAIVRLRFFEGLSLRQVAERLQRNHELVRQRFHA